MTHDRHPSHSHSRRMMPVLGGEGRAARVATPRPSPPASWPASGLCSMSPRPLLAMTPSCAPVSPLTSAVAHPGGPQLRRRRTLAPPSRRIRPRAPNAAVVRLDCMTLLVANEMRADGDGGHAGVPLDVARAEERANVSVGNVVGVCRAGTASFIVVSNEVGMGLMPPYPLGRKFRDTQGPLNRHLAHEADAVVLLVAGLPVELKSLSLAREAQARLLFQRVGSTETGCGHDPVVLR